MLFDVAEIIVNMLFFSNFISCWSHMEQMKLTPHDNYMNSNVEMMSFIKIFYI